MLHFPPSNTKAARSAGSSGPSYSLTVEHPAASDVSTSRRPTTAIALATPRVLGRSPRCTCLESINTSIGRPGRHLESRAGRAAALGSVAAAGRDVVLDGGLDGRIALAQLDAVEPRPLALELDRGDGGVREVHGEHDVGWRVTRVAGRVDRRHGRSEEHTSELQSRPHLVCRLLLEKKKKNENMTLPSLAARKQRNRSCISRRD